MNAIVVVDENWAIGKDGGLLVHLPGDLKYYKEKTLGKTVVIGRKTLESFPGGKPLPGRTNLVITANREYQADGCVICHGMDEAHEYLSSCDSDDIFISGGAEIYRLFLEECDSFYVTRIYDSFEADRYFPDLDALGMKITWQSEMQEENGIRYRFLKYTR